MTRVAIQGEAGAFSHEAAHKLLGPDIQLVPCRTFSEAFHAVSSGEADRAVMPVENALAGPVVESLDLLWSSGLTVRGEDACSRPSLRFRATGCGARSRPVRRLPPGRPETVPQLF